MKRAKIIAVIYALCFFGISSTGAQKVLSLHPLFTEQDAILIPEVEGSWTLPGFNWVMSLKKSGDNFYRFIDDVENPIPQYEAVFVDIDGTFFIDLRAIFPGNMGETDFKEGFLPCHSIYKIEISHDTLFIASLNYTWFFNHAIQKNPSFEWVDQGLLLTLSTGALQSFFNDHMYEDGIFNEPDSILVEHDFDETLDTLPDNNNLFTNLLYQQCIPGFPFKNGWLGGDGDVSVPLNDTTTIFFFSDTYVGNEGQNSRKQLGMKMIANSVSVQKCRSDGETDVQYYWCKTNPNNPEAFFQSFTDRYKYWVVDAFTTEKNLYVILSKVGPKLGAAADDLFNFCGLGYTLVKVSNPHLAPDEWTLDLFSLPEFQTFSMEIGSHVVQENYVYFFVSQNDTLQFLVRKPVYNLDCPELPFEYYALNKEWKPGIKPEDMFAITKGFRCNSVNFHSDLKQWVMISDIWFRDNKIKMRTAAALTGPWSDEKTIYEIPEMTPGNSSYSKSKFCYLAREHIQYYDSIHHMMILTYDINSTDFSEIISNPKIYTPKAIKVSLNMDGNY